MRRYIEAVKADVRRRMSPPMRQSVARISEELGIHVVTLYNWRKAWRLQGEARADSKCQLGFSRGCRIAIARSALMSCITACRPSRIESNPARRSRFSAAVRSVARTPAPLPR
jgi:transposase-like protein